MGPKPPKIRADELLVQCGLAPNRDKAKALILAGTVYQGKTQIQKPGDLVSSETPLSLKPSKTFVSRGGEKLLHAVQTFEIEISGKVCADIGSSTGGFTDVLLQGGAEKIYAIDSAYGELDWKLRSHARIVVMERTNIVQLEKLPEELDLITIDVSLLSVLKFLPKVMLWLQPQGSAIALIKPQYEASKEELPPGAVIRDRDLHRRILTRVFEQLQNHGVFLNGLTRSPILGGSGNTEFLALLKNEKAAASQTHEMILEACT